ncbi:Spy/CpxP family protein refolding chaperone [Phenylobacterium sp.]|uniref:Spy/CpxP family protein refolding chaperone n=1 Tax=Phenylobacterium sp. TaxID=1871053 RepID=UPI0035B1C1C4
MTRLTHSALAAALAALLAGGAAAAYAQTSPDEAVRQAQHDARKAERDGRVAAMEARRAGRQAERMRGRPAHPVIVRLDDDRDRSEHLRNILQLRPNQEAALNAYLEAMTPKTDHLVRFDREDGEARRTTPERLAEMEQRLAEREAQGRARIEATRRFYAQLDERQKKAFDELPLMMGPGHFGPGAMHIVHRGAPLHAPLPPPPPAPPRPPAPPSPPSDL